MVLMVELEGKLIFFFTNNIKIYIGFIWDLETPQLVLSCLRAPKTFTGDSGKCVTIMDLSCIYCIVTRLRLWSNISEYSNILKNVKMYKWQGVKKPEFSWICKISCRSFKKYIRKTLYLRLTFKKHQNVLSTWSLLGKILPNLLYLRMIHHNLSHVNL